MEVETDYKQVVKGIGKGAQSARRTHYLQMKGKEENRF